MALPRSLLVGFMVVASCSSSFAAGIDTLVFFGDSLTDEGRAGRTAPVMWAEVLRTDLSIAGTNWAIGGAITANQPSTVFGDSSYLGQVGAFVASGTVTPTTGAAVWIGTNDIWMGSGRGGSATALATATFNNVTTGLQQLAATGVGSATVLGVYDLSLTNAYVPAGTDGVGTRATAAAASEYYNSLLASASVSGLTIAYWDIARFVDHLQKNPQTYGFTRVLPLKTGETCDATCQQTSIFADTIHLTSRAQQLIGDYVASGNPIYNSASFVYGAVAGNIQSAITTVGAPIVVARSRWENLDASAFAELDRRLRATVTGPLAGSTGAWTVFGGLTGTGGTTDANDAPTKLRWNGAGIGFGATRSIGRTVVGFATEAGRTRSDLRDLAGTDTTSTSFQGVAFAGVRDGAFEVSGLVGAGTHFADRTRSGSWGRVTSSPRVDAMWAALRAGYAVDVAGLRITPLVGLGVEAARQPAYTEQGDAYARFVVDGDTYAALTGSIGARFETVSPMALGLAPHAEIAYDRKLASTGGVIGMHYAYLPTQSVTGVGFARRDAVKATFGVGLPGNTSVDLSLDGFVRVDFDESANWGVTGHAAYRF